MSGPARTGEYFNENSRAGSGKVNMTTWMVETTGDIADTFEKNLLNARETNNIEKARKPIQHLTGLAMQGVAAQELGKFVFHNIDNREYHGENGDEKEFDSVDYIVGLSVDISANVRLDRQAVVALKVNYLEEGEGRNIEKNCTSAQGATLMQSGWSKLVFRWDQAFGTRLFILTMDHGPGTAYQPIVDSS